MSTTLITSRDRKGRHAVGLFEAEYDKAGLDGARAQRLNERGGEFQAGIRRLINELVADFDPSAAEEVESSAYEVAREILGQDFISPEEIAPARKLLYTSEQLQQFVDTLPAEDVLVWCRDNGFMLVAGPPVGMSLLYIRQIERGYFHSMEGGWYTESEERFSCDEKVQTQWLALRKEPFPESTYKTWDKQEALLSEVEYIPTTAEVAWGVTTYKAVRDIYLLPRVYVRTSSMDSDGHHVFHGCFDRSGLVVCRWDGSYYDRLGVASARKL